jgi:hypothetical protein
MILWNFEINQSTTTSPQDSVELKHPQKARAFSKAKERKNSPG